jgi:anti-sigma B factor antagonist
MHPSRALLIFAHTPSRVRALSNRKLQSSTEEVISRSVLRAALSVLERRSIGWGGIMGAYQRIEVSSASGSGGDVAVVQFRDRKIMDATLIQQLGNELFGLVDKERRKSILLNLAGVEFLSSAALSKLIVLDKKIKTAGGKLQLCSLKPEIFEIFAITRLAQLFAIKRTEQEALAAF